MNSLNQWRKYAWILLFAVVVYSGCKEGTLINSKISPASDSIGVYQKNLPCITHTYFDDSIVTSATFPGIPVYEGVGNFTDPFFGAFTASTFFQLIPAVNGFYFTSADTVDSAVLVLPYSGFTWGDSTNANLTQTYQVFYMTDSLGEVNTVNYYPGTVKNIDTKNPLSAPFTVNVSHLLDSFLITGKDHSGLRIKLNMTNLMNKLSPALTGYTAAGVPTEQLFINYFNGICVRPADTRQTCTSLPYFELDGTDPYSEAGILVYYHQTIGDTSYAQFLYDNSFCNHYNRIVSSFGHSSVNSLYQSNKANDDIVALQNQPGAGIDLKIAGISSLPQGIISKAEVQLTLLPDYNNVTFFGPQKVFATGIATATYPSGQGLVQGEIYNLADRYPVYSLTPFNVLDGYPHTGVVPNGLTTYTIDIPREVMQAVAQKSDTIHIRINGTTDFYGAYHMVAAGGSYPDSNYRAKLKVVYSQLK